MDIAKYFGDQSTSPVLSPGQLLVVCTGCGKHLQCGCQSTSSGNQMVPAGGNQMGSAGGFLKISFDRILKWHKNCWQMKGVKVDGGAMKYSWRDVVLSESGGKLEPTGGNFVDGWWAASMPGRLAEQFNGPFDVFLAKNAYAFVNGPNRHVHVVAVY